MSVTGLLSMMATWGRRGRTAKQALPGGLLWVLRYASTTDLNLLCLARSPSRASASGGRLLLADLLRRVDYRSPAASEITQVLTQERVGELTGTSKAALFLALGNLPGKHKELGHQAALDVLTETQGLPLTMLKNWIFAGPAADEGLRVVFSRMDEQRRAALLAHIGRESEAVLRCHGPVGVKMLLDIDDTLL